MLFSVSILFNRQSLASFGLAFSLVGSTFSVCGLQSVEAAGTSPPSRQPRSNAAKVGTLSREGSRGLEGQLDKKLLQSVALLYGSGQFEKALGLVEEARHQGADAATVTQLRACLLDKTRPLIYPLAEARLAVRFSPHSSLALTNLAILLQRNGERAEAIEKYRAALATDAANWKAHLGLAQCLAVDGVDGRQIAEHELKLAFATNSDSAEKWAALGATFIVLQDYAQAQDCYSRALKAKPGDYWLRCGLAKACLLNGEKQEAFGLFAEVVNGQLSDPDLALLYAGCGLLSAAELKQILLIGERNFAGNHDFFYKFGRRVEALNNLDLAQQAYLDALNSTTTPAAAVLSAIGNRMQAGDKPAALALYEKYGNVDSAHSRDAFALPLKNLGSLINGGDSSLKIVHAVFRNIKCGCRRPVLELRLRSQPGVVFAALRDEKEPPACFIYDAKVANAQAILNKTRRDEDLVDVISEEPVKSVAELVQLIQTAADQPDKHLFSLWSFQPSSMELPK